MTIIKCLSEKIEEEINDAEAYVELAEKYKEEYPETADLFCELSEEEIGHMEKLHEEVVRLIQEHREKHGEPPKDMMTLYNYLHEKHIKNVTMVKIKIGMYKS